MYAQPSQHMIRVCAQGHYDAQMRRATYASIWARITGRSRHLFNLYQVEQSMEVHDRYAAGVQTVPMAQIRGSEGRCHDFDVQFRPTQSRTRERWISVAVAREQNVGLPLVELIQVNDCYFVRDGHHRISVARAYGQQAIEAIVTVWRCASAPVQPAPEAPESATGVGNVLIPT